jgi:hypothetical protein
MHAPTKVAALASDSVDEGIHVRERVRAEAAAPLETPRLTASLFEFSGSEEGGAR